MKKEINDGGPAMPIPPPTHHEDDVGEIVPNYCLHRGMSLRDYFAAAALQGELAAQAADSAEWLSAQFGYLAGRCYDIADAMLAERAKGGGK